jgi:redox-sensitive bicupin YhaK (pirin superfamily)
VVPFQDRQGNKNMFQIRKANDRGHANHGWLDSWHTFSFADYYDPAHMGFRALRVINDDRIAEGQGFGTHPHRDMEIITYMLEGELAHKDSMGNGRVIKTGEVQGMSAGTGITHSEFNPSPTNGTHLLQIWIMPHTKNVTPAYGEHTPAKSGNWELVASESGAGGTIKIHQDAKMFVAVSDKDNILPLNIPPERFGWIQMATGFGELNGNKLEAGDGVAFSGDEVKQLKAAAGSKILLFDLA